MEQSTVKVAGVQMEPLLLENGANLEKCLRYLREAAGAGARLVVFPECAISGYCFRSREEALPAAETVPGPSTETLAKACAELDAYAVVGLLERDGDSLYNAAVLIGPEGVIGVYRKAHLPYLGVDRFTDKGKEGFVVHQTAIGSIGMHICYDVNFPEGARLMALDGADILVLPTNWPTGREKIPACVVPTRALENRVFYVAVNRVGTERGFSFIGRSRIVDPSGNVLAEAGPEGGEIIYATLDLRLARQKRSVLVPGEFETDVIADRRTDLYKLEQRR